MSKKKVFHDSDSGEDLEEEQEEVEDLLVQSGEESDSDAAPEDVAFTDSKKQVLQTVQAAVEQIGRDREKLKLKRRQREEHYKSQKKKKLAALSQKKLPEDFLEALEEKPIKQIKPTKKAQALDSEVTGVEDETEEDIGDFEVDPDDLSGGEGDFIPLEEQTGIHAIFIKDQVKKPQSSAQAAADFRDQRLFGKYVRREPMREKLGKKTKRKARLL